MTEPKDDPKDDYVGEGGDGSDDSLPEDAPLPPYEERDEDV